ncbi:DUF1995 domain containing protein [Nitzschia inconspicua]|uniref:DUF1995 domain containing protein n=1 Tax=Nitzschia inconspicua TaxID=303405 RepID=A0A9K3Q4V3_9STRA|nr:DUF1995 domain containing protein [Nitzschia inconspicua]
MKKMAFQNVFLGSILFSLLIAASDGLIPLIDGGKDIPKLYQGYFDAQIAKQAATAVGAAIARGKTNIEVQLPAVPNLEEVRFGTPLNQKFGKTVVAKDLKVKGGYFPGSDIARQQVAFANMYWAKQLAGAVGGGILGGKPVTVLSAEPVSYDLIQNKGGIAKMGPLRTGGQTEDAAAVIAISPGGEEQWDRLRNSLTKNSKSPFVVLNNAYSTTYGLGNQRNYEEAYYLKRISKGWVFRAYPGPWKAYLEKPDGSCELLKTYKTKPQLNEVAEIVRDESFKRYAINNDRWMSGRM